MAKVQLTNYELFRLRDDINKTAGESLWFRYFMGNKVNQFFSQNAFTLRLMDKKIKDLVYEYAIHDNQDNPITVKKEDGREYYTFVDEAAEKEYNKVMNEFMARSNHIEI